jgi:hypothetical protein
LVCTLVDNSSVLDKLRSAGNQAMSSQTGLMDMLSGSKSSAFSKVVLRGTTPEEVARWRKLFQGATNSLA